MTVAGAFARPDKSLAIAQKFQIVAYVDPVFVGIPQNHLRSPGLGIRNEKLQSVLGPIQAFNRHGEYKYSYRCPYPFGGAPRLSCPRRKLSRSDSRCRPVDSAPIPSRPAHPKNSESDTWSPAARPFRDRRWTKNPAPTNRPWRFAILPGKPNRAALRVTLRGRLWSTNAARHPPRKLATRYSRGRNSPIFHRAKFSRPRWDHRRSPELSPIAFSNRTRSAKSGR